jgi:putative SOS response-associated peptidase YedK
MAFAGLAETWTGPNGEELDTVAIVTAAARGGLAMLHSRVPVTILPEDHARWLDGNAADAGEVMPLLRAPADNEYVCHEVSTRVNRVANDDAQLVLPISAEEAAEAHKPAEKIMVRKPIIAASADDGQGSLF